MRLLHSDYKKLVIAAYHEKLLNNTLRPSLVIPTPANIRRECATVYKERYDKRDEPVLRDFFRQSAEEKRFLQHIEEFEVDKFRRLDSFLKEKGRVGITDRNLNLLAWLIDFKHRPYALGMEVFLTEKEKHILDTDGPYDFTEPVDESEFEKEITENNIEGETGHPDEEDNENNHQQMLETIVSIPEEGMVKPGSAAQETIIPVTRSGGNKGISGNRPVIIVASVILFVTILVGSIYAILRQGENAIISFGNNNTGCMYWINDHYEKVPCDSIINQGQKVPFDAKQAGLRRITLKDTISEKSIGKVHYIKDGEIKYYTGEGIYPDDTSKNLKKLSTYMFNKYLRQRADSASFSLAENK